MTEITLKHNIIDKKTIRQVRKYLYGYKRWKQSIFAILFFFIIFLHTLIFTPKSLHVEFLSIMVGLIILTSFYLNTNRKTYQYLAEMEETGNGNSYDLELVFKQKYLNIYNYKTKNNAKVLYEYFQYCYITKDTYVLILQSNSIVIIQKNCLTSIKEIDFLRFITIHCENIHNLIV